jgi:hypothetical protein
MQTFIRTHYLSLKSINCFLVSVILLFLCGGCKPQIYEFTVRPLVIGPTDSIKVSWKAKGNASIMINDRFIGKDTTYRVITLVVKRNGSESARHQEVQVLNKGGEDVISFRTKFSGNNLVASGIKSTLRWGNGFKVETVSNASGRSLDISHEGRTLHLEKGANASVVFAGTAVKGPWELRSAITAAERADSTNLPHSLSISITVKHN